MSIITPQFVFFSLVGLGQAIRVFNNGTTTTTHNVPQNATAFYKSPGQVLSIPLKHVERQDVRTPSLAKRYFGSEVMGVYGAAYFAELAIGTGTDPQTVDVLLDTGSFELWVNPDCASTTAGDLCNTFGRYDPKQSTTSKNLNKNFGIQYGQGNASGDYYQDDVYISGAKVEGQQFGVSTQSSDVWFGILGLGRGQGNGIMDYPSVVDQLATQGYTDSKLFSLDLGGQPGPTAAITGEIVFGGVDTNKYAGNLMKVPIDPSDPHYQVTLTSLTLQPPNSNPNTNRNHKPPTHSKYDFHTTTTTKTYNYETNDNLSIPVIIDSGTTLSLLPEPVVAALAANFPGAKPDGNGGYTVPCALRDEDKRVHFGFRGEGDANVMLAVRYSDFIWQADTDQCVLGAWYTEDIGLWILGDTFLRGAYVTFDQTNNGLYMAEYVRCGEESNLVPVPAGLDAAANIPGSCTAGAQQKPNSPATVAHDSSSVSIKRIATKIGLDTTNSPSPIYTPVPHTGPADAPHHIPITATAGDKQVLHPIANSPAASNEKCNDKENNVQPQQESAAVQTLTNTIIRHVAYTADGHPTTRLETVQVLTTMSAQTGDDVVFPQSTGAPDLQMLTTSSSAATQSQAQAGYQILSHAMPSPSAIQQQQQQQQQQSIPAANNPNAGATPVAYGGMGWGFNNTNPNNHNNNNNVASNSLATGNVPGIAAPTHGGMNPIVVPAPAPTKTTPTPAVPIRPTVTQSGFFIGSTSGAERQGRLDSSGLGLVVAVLVPALGLVAC